MKQKKTCVEDRYRYLLRRYEALKASSPGGSVAGPPAAVSADPEMEAEADAHAPSATELEDEDEAATQGAWQMKLSFGCWQCFLVCLPQVPQASKGRGMV